MAQEYGFWQKPSPADGIPEFLPTGRICRIVFDQLVGRVGSAVIPDTDGVLFVYSSTYQAAHYVTLTGRNLTWNFPNNYALPVPVTVGACGL